MKNSDNIFDVTLDDDNWKDSFDRLLNKRSLLRELNVLKNNVRISFNNDSSVEASPLEKTEAKIQSRKRISESISTPKAMNKAFGPFDCTLSPISTWRLTYGKQNDPWNSTNNLKSTLLDKITESIDDSSPSSKKSPKQSIQIPSHRNTISVTEINGESSAKVNNNLAPPNTDKSLQSNPIIEINEVSSENDSLAPLRTEKSTPAIPIIEINGESSADENDSLAPLNIDKSLRATETQDNRNISMLLPPGKWRRSLTVWKRVNQLKTECLDRLTINNTHQCTLNIRNSRKTSFLGRRTQLSIGPKRRKELELLKICKQTSALLFSSLYSNTAMRKCRKIGEGTYGEVFLNAEKNDQTVIKIIPIERDVIVNGEPQKTFETILPEIVITNELSKLRLTKAFATSGFVFLKNVRYFQGKYPDHFMELWDLYEENNGSENDRPDVFKDDQLYVSLEIAFGGKDLEGYVFKNSEQAYSAFLQVTFSLAVAEKLLEFEHRDLHVGNILIETTNDKHIEFVVNKKTIQIPSHGVKATIIDYTLSRVLSNKCTFYNDLSVDEELFCAVGDYQYDIYRMMKEKLDNNWESFEPQTNVMWLHYLLVKLIDCSKYKNNKSKQHKLHLDRLKSMRDNVMTYSSAYDFSSNLRI